MNEKFRLKNIYSLKEEKGKQKLEISFHFQHKILIKKKLFVLRRKVFMFFFFVGFGRVGQEFQEGFQAPHFSMLYFYFKLWNPEIQ